MTTRYQHRSVFLPRTRVLTNIRSHQLDLSKVMLSPLHTSHFIARNEVKTAQWETYHQATSTANHDSAPQLATRTARTSQSISQIYNTQQFTWGSFNEMHPESQCEVSSVPKRGSHLILKCLTLFIILLIRSYPGVVAKFCVSWRYRQTLCTRMDSEPQTRQTVALTFVPAP